MSSIFEGSRCFGKKEMQDVIIERDNTKIQLCSENGIRLLHFGNPCAKI